MKVLTIAVLLAVCCLPSFQVMAQAPAPVPKTLEQLQQDQKVDVLTWQLSQANMKLLERQIQDRQKEIDALSPPKAPKPTGK
jgi:hypothetical protein